jgi:hypothetical protein
MTIAATIASSAEIGAQNSACSGRSALAHFVDKQIDRPIFLLNDTLLFRTGNIELDIDGSPRAYGVQDQGTENICNGLGPLEPPRCRGRNRGECASFCKAAFRSWDGQTEHLGRVMCSIGLGGSGCGTPNVRLQPAPAQDWFVSETSVHPAPSGPRPADWARRQEGQLDSLQIPYFVIPGAFRHLPWDATPGDVGLVVDAQGHSFAFIIGDGGGHLDEGSAALLARIRGVSQLPTQPETNAFGRSVERLHGAVAGDYSVAIFRHSGRSLPNQPTMLTLTAAELPAFIERVAAERLRPFGSASAIRACAR